MFTLDIFWIQKYFLRKYLDVIMWSMMSMITWPVENQTVLLGPLHRGIASSSETILVLSNMTWRWPLWQREDDTYMMYIHIHDYIYMYTILLYIYTMIYTITIIYVYIYNTYIIRLLVFLLVCTWPYFQGRHPQADPWWTGASHGEAHRAREPRKCGRGGALRGDEQIHGELGRPLYKIGKIWENPCKNMGQSMELWENHGSFSRRHGGVGKIIELNGFSIFQQATCDYQKAYHLIPFLNFWTCDQLSRIRAGSLTNAIDRANVVLQNVIRIKFTKIHRVFIKGNQSKVFWGFNSPRGLYLISSQKVFSMSEMKCKRCKMIGNMETSRWNRRLFGTGEKQGVNSEYRTQPKACISSFKRSSLRILQGLQLPKFLGIIMIYDLWAGNHVIPLHQPLFRNIHDRLLTLHEIPTLDHIIKQFHVGEAGSQGSRIAM